MALSGGTLLARWASQVLKPRTQIRMTGPLITELEVRRDPDHNKGAGLDGTHLLVLVSASPPVWVEPASPIELTTSRTEALQARWLCASPLETFTQSFLHCFLPKIHGPERGSRSALNVIAHVFSWHPVWLRHVRGGVGRSKSLISSPSGRLAAWPNQRSLLCRRSAGVLVRQLYRSFTGGTQSLPLTCRMRRMLSLSDLQHPFAGYSYRQCLVTVDQNRAHHCLVDPAFCTQRYFTQRTKTGLSATECGMRMINPASDLLGVLAI